MARTDSSELSHAMTTAANEQSPRENTSYDIFDKPLISDKEQVPMHSGSTLDG